MKDRGRGGVDFVFSRSEIVFPSAYNINDRGEDEEFPKKLNS